MKIVSKLIILIIYIQTISSIKDISERPFVYDGPFRHFFDFSFLLEKDDKGNITSEDPVLNKEVTK